MKHTRLCPNVLLNMLGLILALIGYGLPWFENPGHLAFPGFELIAMGKIEPLLALVFSFLSFVTLMLLELRDTRKIMLIFVLTALFGFIGALLVNASAIVAYPEAPCILTLGIGFFVSKIGMLLQFISGVIPAFSEGNM